MGKKIDAEELYHRMYEEAFEKDSDLQKWDSGCWIRFKLFENVLKDMPEIEVEEKTGHWILPKNDDGTSETIEYQVRCSECGLVLDPQTYSELKMNNGINYCCRCGAEMKGVKQ